MKRPSTHIKNNLVEFASSRRGRKRLNPKSARDRRRLFGVRDNARGTTLDRSGYVRVAIRRGCGRADEHAPWNDSPGVMKDSGGRFSKRVRYLHNYYSESSAGVEATAELTGRVGAIA